MYELLPHSGRRRWSAAITVSIALHCLALYIVCRRPAAIFVQPQLLVRGDFGKSTLIYSPSAPAAPKVRTRRTQDALTYKHNSFQFAPRNTGSRSPQEKTRPTEEAATSVRAGSPFGSRYEGTTLGSEVRPAIPTIFPDPPISRIEAPTGVEGDVVVEITIDEAGNVTDARVLQSVGYGIEQKVMATLRNWRFRPATKDGSPIPSKQDYKFHFPS